MSKLSFDKHLVTIHQRKQWFGPASPWKSKGVKLISSVANLLKTAVSVLASTVRLNVSFMEPLMTVSVILRWTLQVVSSDILDLPQPLDVTEEQEEILGLSQPWLSISISSKKKKNKKKGGKKQCERTKAVKRTVLEWHWYISICWSHLPNIMVQWHPADPVSRCWFP